MVRLIITIVAFALALCIFFMYTQPTYDSTRELKDKIRQYNQALDKAAELQQLKQALLSRYNAFDPTDLSRLQKLLPNHVDNVRLILDIDNLAGRYGMALQNDVISTPGKDKENEEESSLGAIGESQQKFDSLTLQFSTQATYPLFMQFLQELESSLRIVDLVSLTLTPETDTTASKEPIYRFGITIKTYWLKEYDVSFFSQYSVSRCRWYRSFDRSVVHVLR